jgi:hypothetical protein
MPTSAVLPPRGFESRRLDLVELPYDGNWFRLYRSKYPDPLGYGFASSRFSDPETHLSPPDLFEVVYLGSTLKVCFAETILRDRGDGRLDDFPIEWSELEEWTCGQLRVKVPLNLVDLRGDGLIRMGIPSDVSRAISRTRPDMVSCALGA